MPDGPDTWAALCVELSPPQLLYGPAKSGQTADQIQFPYPPTSTSAIVPVLKFDRKLRYVQIHNGPTPYRWNQASSIVVAVTSPQGVVKTQTLFETSGQNILTFLAMPSLFAGTGFGKYTMQFSITWSGQVYVTDTIAANLVGLLKK